MLLRMVAILVALGATPVDKRNRASRGRGRERCGVVRRLGTAHAATIGMQGMPCRWTARQPFNGRQIRVSNSGGGVVRASFTYSSYGGSNASSSPLCASQVS